MFSWVFAVLRAKGASEEAISRLSHIYQDSITIPVINNVPGRPLSNIRGCLRQGCPGSMGWFSLAIDPLLLYLSSRLTGIPICSIPTAGPKLADGTPPQSAVENYIVYGYADDVKPSVTTMAEFALVDHAAKLFEASSGCKLHRDPVTGKCKVLPLGRWRNSLQQEDIGFPYLHISDRLSMVGVELTASWQASRKINNDDLQSKVEKCINSWRAGKFMPLICRPFSLNTYCLSKVWFRTSSVDLRVGDITAITKKIKSYCYQDLYQKPSEVLLYRPAEQGGLGLHHVASKAKANLITTFLQTATSKTFQQSLYHSWLYRYHVLGHTELTNPGIPPYYAGDFFNVIREVQENSPLNPTHMTVKQWYNYLLETNVIEHEIDEEGRRELVPCKVEEREPSAPWLESYRLSRLKGISPQTKSFNFKLIHTLLPSKERVHHLNPNLSPLCWCNSGEDESYTHLFFICRYNKEAGDALLRCVRSYDSELTESKALTFRIKTDGCFEMAIVSLLSTGLEVIWSNRLQKRRTNLVTMRSDLEWAAILRRKSRNSNQRSGGHYV